MSERVEYGTFEAALERSRVLEKKLEANPEQYKILTGDRPTGRLHIGHYFGSLQNRVRLHRLGVPTYIVIADYQVLTDRTPLKPLLRTCFSLQWTICPPVLTRVTEKRSFSRTVTYRS